MPLTAVNSDKNLLQKNYTGLKSVLNLILFLTAFGLLYYDTLVHIVGTWSRPEGAHGPLILAVSLYLTWQKRKTLKNLPKQPAILHGALLSGLGCLVLFTGKLSNTILLQQISIVPTLLGAILLFWGFQHFKLLLLPTCYLIFLTGFFEEILGSVSIYLQIVSAWIAAQLLSLVGMPVLLTTTVIKLPHIALKVVRACSGINHIVALMALAIPLAHMSQKTILRKVILVSASFVIAIFANGLRVALIGIYALYNKGADLHGPNETLYVSFIFFFGLIVVFILSHFLNKIGLKHQKVNSDPIAATSFPNANHLSMHAKPEGNRHGIGNGLKPFIVGFCIFLLTLVSVHLYKPAPVYLQKSLARIPSSIQGFSSQNVDEVDKKIRPFPADEELIRVYENSVGEKVDLYVGYFNIQNRENKIIDYRRDWLHENAQSYKVGQGSQSVVINRTRLKDGYPQTHVYFWYVIDDRLVTSRYAGKFLTFWSALTARKTNGAVVIIQTQIPESEIKPFLTELIFAVQNHLSDI